MRELFSWQKAAAIKSGEIMYKGGEVLVVSESGIPSHDSAVCLRREHSIPVLCMATLQDPGFDLGSPDGIRDHISLCDPE